MLAEGSGRVTPAASRPARPPAARNRPGPNHVLTADSAPARRSVNSGLLLRPSFHEQASCRRVAREDHGYATPDAAPALVAPRRCVPARAAAVRTKVASNGRHCTRRRASGASGTRPQARAQVPVGGINGGQGHWSSSCFASSSVASSIGSLSLPNLRKTWPTVRQASEAGRTVLRIRSVGITDTARPRPAHGAIWRFGLSLSVRITDTPALTCGQPVDEKKAHNLRASLR
ncbi:UNVERIFIED_ORG: hypothetical protein BDU10_9810 [Burkholderia sp. CF145]